MRVGSSSSLEGGTLVQVEDFIYHPKFSYTKMDSDIGLLKLKTPLEFSDMVKPIEMVGHGEEIDDGALTEVSGWGNIKVSTIFIIAELSLLLDIVFPALAAPRTSFQSFSALTAIGSCAV